MRILKRRTPCASLCAVCVLGVPAECCRRRRHLSVMRFDIRYRNAGDGLNAWEQGDVREHDPDI